MPWSPFPEIEAIEIDQSDYYRFRLIALFPFVCGLLKESKSGFPSEDPPIIFPLSLPSESNL